MVQAQRGRQLQAKKGTLKPDESKAELARIAERLKSALNDVDRGFVYLSQTDAEFLSTAFETFLSGKAKNLDDAFRVKRGPGAPKRPVSDEILDVVSMAIFSRAKSWKDIADETGRDPRNLQRLVKRHTTAAIEKVAGEIVTDLEVKDRARNRSKGE